MQHPDLAGKVAVITGGTGGVGYKIAERLAREGAAVIINGRSEERGEQAVHQLGALSNRVRFVPGDCRRYADVTAMVQAATDLGDRLDILVSAGSEGGVGPLPFAEMTADQLEESIRDRMYPRLFTVHAALPALRQHGGSAVLLTTDAARHPTVGESVIGAIGAGVILLRDRVATTCAAGGRTCSSTKAGCGAAARVVAKRALTKTLGKELAPHQVRVNSVALTLTSDTPAWDRIFAQPGFQRDLFTKALERFPFGRPPTADEVASVAVFLASESAKQVTGQTISVNGGLSFGGW